MNRFIGSGMLTHPGRVFGTTKKVLRFTLNTFVCRTKKDEQPVWWSVPCVVFSPSDGLVQIIIENFQWKHINLEGKLNTSTFTSHGIIKFSTDVIVEERNIEIYDSANRLATRPLAEIRDADQTNRIDITTTNATPKENTNELHDSADSVAAA